MNFLNVKGHWWRVAGGRVYLMTNRKDGTIYVGVTSDVPRRTWEHREGAADGFTKRYGLKRLVYFERHEDIRDAIHREHRIKKWQRAWKVRLIHVEQSKRFIETARGIGADEAKEGAERAIEKAVRPDSLRRQPSR